MDANDNLVLPSNAEIKVGTKRIKIDTNGELQIANDGTNFEDADGGFRRQINNAPVGSSMIKGHDNSTIYSPPQHFCSDSLVLVALHTMFKDQVSLEVVLRMQR